MLGNLETGIARIQNDIGSEIQHFFKGAGRNIQNHTHAAGNAAEIPDMADRRGQCDMPHALTAHLSAGNLHAALIAYLFLIAVFDAFIFAAVALPVLRRAKDAFAEQAVPFGLQGAVVNGFRLCYLAVGPFENLFGRGHADLNGI